MPFYIHLNAGWSDPMTTDGNVVPKTFDNPVYQEYFEMQQKNENENTETDDTSTTPEIVDDKQGQAADSSPAAKSDIKTDTDIPKDNVQKRIDKIVAERNEVKRQAEKQRRAYEAELADIKAQLANYKSKGRADYDSDADYISGEVGKSMLDKQAKMHERALENLEKSVADVERETHEIEWNEKVQSSLGDEAYKYVTDTFSEIAQNTEEINSFMSVYNKILESPVGPELLAGIMYKRNADKGFYENLLNSSPIRQSQILREAEFKIMMSKQTQQPQQVAEKKSVPVSVVPDTNDPGVGSDDPMAEYNAYLKKRNGHY